MSFDIVGHLRIIDNATRPLRSMTSGLLKFGVAAAGIGAVASTVAIVGDSLKKAMDFESQIQSIKALTGASADEMAKMQALALEQGAKTKYSALEAAQGIEELLKAGLTPAQVQADGLNAALNLATAGGLELADAAEIMSTALNAFKKDEMSAARAADILAGTANASATSVQELRLSLQAVSAVASGVGMSFADTNVALGLFANNGIKSSDAGTSLKTMISNLVPMTDKAYALFEQFNLLTVDTTAAMEFLANKGIKSTGNSLQQVTGDVEKYVAQMKGLKVGTSKAAKETQKFLMANNLVHSAFYDERGEIKKLAEVADVLQDRFGKLTSEQRQYYMYQLFGSDAIRAGNILFKEGAEGVQKFYDEMGKVTALKVAEEKMNSAAGAIEQFRGAVETLQISALTPLMPIIRKLAGGAAGLVAEYTPQITAAVQRMVDSAESYVNTHFINNPRFQSLPDIQSKIKFIFEDLSKTFQKWLDAGGANKIQDMSRRAIDILGESLKASQPLIEAAMTLGTQVGIAITKGIGQGLGKLLIGEKGVEVVQSRFSDEQLVRIGGKLPDNVERPDASGAYYAGNKALGHSGGLDYVPYSGYTARLHQGEEVLTATEARNRRDGNSSIGGPSVMVTGNTFVVRNDNDIDDIANRIALRLAQ